MKLIDMLPDDAVAHGRWWGKALSLVSGCTHVSRGCDHCWAEAMAARFNDCLVLDGHGRWDGVIKTNYKPLDDMERRRKPTVYAVWNDLFHEDVPTLFQIEAFARMREAKQHVFIVCTKRPLLMSEFSRNIIGGFPQNVIAMTSVEDQATADKRIPWLLRTVAAIRAVNVESMLGPVDIPSAASLSWFCGAGINWVLCGGESGPGARPVHPNWVRSVRDQCQMAGVPFWFKQWGEWAPKGILPIKASQFGVLEIDGTFHDGFTGWNGRDIDPDTNESYVLRIGSKAAGRMLDGRIWNESPEVAGR